MTAQNVYKNFPQKPTGKAKHSPCYNVSGRKRRRFLDSAIRRLATVEGRNKLTRKLRELCGKSRCWVRKANHDGLESVRELLLAILDDLNLITWQTRHTLEILAERAGLVTVSDNGNKSISRASRACDRLSLLGLIITEKALFNPKDAHCSVKHIDVTEAFFGTLDIKTKTAYRERALLLKTDPTEVISSWDSRLIALRVENWQRMAAAGLARMAAKNERARELKRAHYAAIT